MKRMTSNEYNPCLNCNFYSSCSHIRENSPVCPERARYDRLAAIEDILGNEYDLGRLRELVEADKDGGCVVLPCKPSDVTVYQLRNKKHALGSGVHPRHVYCATVWSGGRYQLEHQGYEPCRDRDFGKAWFLTQEEAALALGAEKNE